jgi:hypothetical protein
MKQFKIEIDEQVSIWQRVVMWVEAEDEADLRKNVERKSLNIIDVCSVEDFPETIEHISYDPEYFDIIDSERQFYKEAV